MNNYSDFEEPLENGDTSTYQSYKIAFLITYLSLYIYIRDG